MHNAQHSYLGFHGHALLLSLPPALLVWAILTFTLSIIVSAMNAIAGGGVWVRVSSWTIFGIFIVLLVTVLLALYTFSIIYKFHRPTVRMWLRIPAIWKRSSRASVIVEHV